MRHLITVILSISVGIFVVSCGPKRRPIYYQSPATQAVVATKVVVDNPPEPVEGRLISGRFAARGNATKLGEPFAAHGRWQAESWGWLWVPGWLDGNGIISAVEQEINTTVPDWSHLGLPSGPPGVGPKPNTRIIIIDGRFSVSYEGGPPQREAVLYWGTYGFKAGPIAAKCLAEMMASGKTPQLIQPFAPGRFLTGQLVGEKAAAAVSH